MEWTPKEARGDRIESQGKEGPQPGKYLFFWAGGKEGRILQNPIISEKCLKHMSDKHAPSSLSHLVGLWARKVTTSPALFSLPVTRLMVPPWQVISASDQVWKAFSTVLEHSKYSISWRVGIVFIIDFIIIQLDYGCNMLLWFPNSTPNHHCIC